MQYRAWQQGVNHKIGKKKKRDLIQDWIQNKKAIYIFRIIG